MDWTLPNASPIFLSVLPGMRYVRLLALREKISENFFSKVFLAVKFVILMFLYSGGVI